MTATASTIPNPREPRVRNVPLLRSLSLFAPLFRTTTARPDLRNGTLSLLDQGIVSGTSFFTSVVIGRLCSQEELGIYYLALSFILIARGIQEQLISAPYVVYSQSRPEAARALYAGSSLLHFLTFSGVVLIIQCALLALIAIGIGPGNLAPVAWVLLGALPFLQLREVVRRMALAHLRLTTAVVIDVGVALFQIGGLLALAYWQRLTVPLAYCIMGTACMIACGGWFFAERKSLRFSWSSAIADWWHNWGFARWALASHVIGFATPSLMPYLLAALRGSAEAGILAACVGIVGLANTFMIGLAAFLYPRAARAFAQGGTSELVRVLRVATVVYALVLGAFATLVLVSGDFLLVLAFGAKYAGYGTTLGVLSLSMFAQCMGLTPGIGLWSIERPRANLPADVLTLIVTASLAICLIPPFGVLGAALGDLGGKSVGAAVRYLTLRQLLKTFPQSSAE